MTRPALLARLLTWWSDLRCQGGVDYLTKDQAIALNLLPTSSLDVSPVNPDQVAMFYCGKWGKKCERCTCFKTMRKRFPRGGDWEWDLKMVFGATKRESNRDNRDGKAAEINNANVNMRDVTRDQSGVTGRDCHLEPVHIPIAPSVEHAQNSTDQSDSQRAGLKDCRVHSSFPHGSAHYQRGYINLDQTMLTRVYTAMLVLLLAGILSTAYLLDGPSDIEAAQDTASAAADAAHTAKTEARFQRAASRACGSAGGWALINDNTVQCITRHGRQIITAGVAL